MHRQLHLEGKILCSKIEIDVVSSPFFLFLCENQVNSEKTRKSGQWFKEFNRSTETNSITAKIGTGFYFERFSFSKETCKTRQ